MNHGGYSSLNRGGLLTLPRINGSSHIRNYDGQQPALRVQMANGGGLCNRLCGHPDRGILSGLNGRGTRSLRGTRVHQRQNHVGRCRDLGHAIAGSPIVSCSSCGLCIHIGIFDKHVLNLIPGKSQFSASSVILSVIIGRYGQIAQPRSCHGIELGRSKIRGCSPFQVQLTGRKSVDGDRIVEFCSTHRTCGVLIHVGQQEAKQAVCGGKAGVVVLLKPPVNVVSRQQGITLGQIGPAIEQRILYLVPVEGAGGGDLVVVQPFLLDPLSDHLSDQRQCTSDLILTVLGKISKGGRFLNVFLHHSERLHNRRGHGGRRGVVPVNVGPPSRFDQSIHHTVSLHGTGVMID